jgi:hypothetical protein
VTVEPEALDVLPLPELFAPGAEKPHAVRANAAVASIRERRAVP